MESAFIDLSRLDALVACCRVACARIGVRSAGRTRGRRAARNILYGWRVLMVLFSRAVTVLVSWKVVACVMLAEEVQ